MTDNLPFALQITGLHDALSLAKIWATHTVSLLDPEYNGELPIHPDMSRICRLYFNDSTPEDADEYAWYYKMNPVLADKQQAQTILAFTEQLQPSDKLLVHCHAGISRSTAAACGILCQHGLSVEQAIAAVLSVREIAYPNPHLIALFDELLNLRGALIAEVKQQFR